MNDSSFISFYLHLANQKTHFNLVLKNQVLFKYSSQPHYTKQSFTLLAFNGLNKSFDCYNEIALTAWKNALGYKNLKKPFFSLQQLYQIGLKYKVLTKFQKLNFPKKNLYLDQSVKQNNSGILFPKYLNNSYVKKAVTPESSSFCSSKFQKSSKAFQLTFSSKNAFLATHKSDSSFQQPALAANGEKLENFKARKKQISNLCQKILNQSFKNHFIDHLKKIEKFAEVKTNQKLQLLNSNINENNFFSKAATNQSLKADYQNESFIWKFFKAKSGKGRNDHQMSLFSWTPVFDKTGAYFNVSKPYTSMDSPKSVLSTVVIKNENGHPSDFGLLYQCKPKGHKSVSPEFKHSSSYSNTNLLESSKRFCKTEKLMLQHKVGIDPFTRINKHEQLSFENYLMLSKLSLYNSVQKKQLQFFFDHSKKETTLNVKQDLLTKFYSASWLLQYIQTELGFRNANLKRVLNNIFLYTQLPILKLSQNRKAVKADYFQNLNEKASSTLESTKTELYVVPDIIKGLRVTFSGRLGGKKGMAKTLTKTTGRVPLSTLKEKVDFAKGVVHTKNGTLGVKVWICFN